MTSRLRSTVPLWMAAALVLPATSSRAQQPPAAHSPSTHRSRHTATGTMAGFDPDTRELTVASATGTAAYHLASDARVWLGNRRLPVAQLKARVGAQVTVSWSDTEGVRTTHTVRVASEPQQ